MGPDIRQLFVWYHVWRNRLELLNKRSKLASAADSVDGKEFQI